MGARESEGQPRRYGELSRWWPLLSRPEDYAEEASAYWSLLEHVSGRDLGGATVLELGSGGGNNASHLKKHAKLTLCDLSPDMLAVSRRLNPECEHIEGDMRSIRVCRSFDVVFVHDAVGYMTAHDDLSALAVTCREHCRPGGLVLIVPDWTRETFVPGIDTGGHDSGDGQRGLRYLEWTLDVDPSGHRYQVHMAYLLREGTAVRLEHDTNWFGLFARNEWFGILQGAGLDGVECVSMAFGSTAFIARRPV